MENPEDLLESLTLISARPEWKASLAEKLRKRERLGGWVTRLLLGLALLGGGSYALREIHYAWIGVNTEAPKPPPPPPPKPRLFELIQTDQREELKAQLAQDHGLLEQTAIRDLTPLHYAILTGRFECAAILLDKGASLEARDPGTSRNILRDALSLAPPELVQKLAGREKLEFANPDESLESAWSWLWWKNPAYFQVLLRSRPMLNWNDESALDLWKQVAERGNPNLVEQMVSLGAPLDKLAGSTPLVLARRAKNREAVYRLLDLGADPRAGKPNLLSLAGSPQEKKIFGQAAELSACRANLRATAIRLEEWASTHHDHYPERLEQLPGPRAQLNYRGLGRNYELSCPDQHLGLPKGQPKFSAEGGMIPERLRFEPSHP